MQTEDVETYSTASLCGGLERAILEVRTSNAYTDKALPYKRSFDWSNDGGIYRSVKLHVSGKYAIRYVHATPQSSTGLVRFDLRLFDQKVNKVTAQEKHHAAPIPF